MTPSIRPRRSVLFMPGSSARALEKARTLPADALVLDLEDAVAPDAKVRARAQVLAALRAGGHGRREVIVRVNALATPWGRDDLAAAATSGADAVLLPKVESPATVTDAMSLLGPGPALWCMLETPRGMHLEDQAGFAAACRQAADLGFDGKTLIHPGQIATANEVFAPAGADVAWACRVIAAHADAVAGGSGVALLDGRLIENLHVEDARRVLALAEAIESLARG